jgi:hypothetical protein
VVDWRRVAVTSMFGFGFVGPVGHFWYYVFSLFLVFTSFLVCFYVGVIPPILRYLPAF